MKTCCSSGKARVYYNLPKKGELKYRLKGEKVWKTITVVEPLECTCITKYNGLSYSIAGHYDTFDKTTNVFKGRTSFSAIVLGPILGFEEVNITGGSITFGSFSLRAITQQGSHIIVQKLEYNTLAQFTYTVQRLNGEDPKQFTITGTETNTKYVDIEVDECPDVQTIPCKFDPAKEQYQDIVLSTSPNVESCIEIWEADPNPVTGGLGVHIVLIKIVRDHKGGPRPPIWSSRGYHYSPKGCPPPKVRVECCTTPDCQNNKKCPKGTTCEIVCGGFKCCYSKGVLIRSIKL
jgi:hypothetical protein